MQSIQDCAEEGWKCLIVFRCKIFESIYRGNNEYNESPSIIGEILQKYEGVQFLTTTDLTSGYWQIPLSKESRKGFRTVLEMGSRSNGLYF